MGEPALGSLELTITPILLFLAFLVLCAAWAVYSMILRYHWKEYGVNKLQIMLMSLIYGIGSLVLIGLILLSLLLYANTSL